MFVIFQEMLEAEDSISHSQLGICVKKKKKKLTTYHTGGHKQISCQTDEMENEWKNNRLRNNRNIKINDF